MGSDAEERIIRLLTELRDAQREELAYRRRVLDESLALQRRAVRFQRVGLFIVLLLLAIGLGLIAVALLGPRRAAHAALDPAVRFVAERPSPLDVAGEVSGVAPRRRTPDRFGSDSRGRSCEDATSGSARSS